MRNEPLAVQVLNQSGHFTEAICEWETSQSQKTWNGFTVHFNAAFNRFFVTDECKSEQQNPKQLHRFDINLPIQQWMAMAMVMAMVVAMEMENGSGT